MKYLSVDDLNFNSYTPGNGIRTPALILNHINGLLLYISSFLVDIPNTFPDELNFEDEVKRFKSLIKKLDCYVLCNELASEMTYKQILQGPLADIMLHIGELSMQRKYSGNPADDIENYIYADITAGEFK
ncbi:MAG: hypothetical protein PQJ46_13915 [Spirochaetales bacterium]|nr:hypothetical protein [Spirochaetales bacterium]